MYCQICKKREATIHFTNVVDKKVEKIHLCAQCAEEKGFDYLKKSNYAMGDLLAGLLDSAAKAAESGSSKDKCPTCGTNYENFKKVGRLGCSHCYEHFKTQLMPLLRSIHGNTRHMGKVPERLGSRVSLKRRVLELREELNQAVELENYERAAQLRDEIKMLESSNDAEGE
jgi:protein arginine kinase activator